MNVNIFGKQSTLNRLRPVSSNSITDPTSPSSFIGMQNGLSGPRVKGKFKKNEEGIDGLPDDF